MSETVHALHKEIEAARLLCQQMAGLLSEDPDFRPDLVEGETNLNEAVQAIVDQFCQDKVAVDAIGEHIKLMQARQDRLKQRMAKIRAMVAVALDLAGKKRVETPLGNVTLKRVPPNVIIDSDDEHKIPLKYWKTGNPVLDKKALKADLERGEQVEGAKLDNGNATCQFTFR